MNHLALLAKHWTAGKAKTRLAATIGDEPAADLHRQFVVTLAERLRTVGDCRTMWYTPGDRRGAFAAAVGDGWRLMPQAAGDLPARMKATLTEELVADATRVVLLGTDSPNLPLEWVTTAFDLLAEVRLVLGPASDGGYYLIAVRGALPPVFDGMPFSTPQLWRATLVQLAADGWQQGTDYEVLPPWYDVDTADDLDRLVRDLRQPSGPLAPPLARLLQFIDSL